jgi:hypothetical protein
MYISVLRYLVRRMIATIRHRNAGAELHGLNEIDPLFINTQTVTFNNAQYGSTQESVNVYCYGRS